MKVDCKAHSINNHLEAFEHVHKVISISGWGDVRDTPLNYSRPSKTRSSPTRVKVYKNIVVTLTGETSIKQ